MASIGYLVIILPIIGSGIAIGVDSWRRFWQRRSLANGAVAGYNTFANVYNVYQATRGVPSALDGVSKLFKGDSKDKGGVLVVAIVVFALLAGILTTYTIITVTARKTAMRRAFKFAEDQV